MNKTKISIVMPVYNAEKYLEETLNSICGQSFTDYELIAIDDGSTDASLSILNKYKDTIVNMKIIANKNSGVSRTRNQGINIAIGEYICFVDSDDILHKDYLSKLYKPVEFSEVDIVYCGYKVFYDTIDFEEKDFIEIKNDDASDVIDLFNYVMEQGLGIPLWNKLYKLDLLKNNRIYFNEDLSYGEDMFFNWKVFLLSKNVYHVDELLYGYRQNIRGVTMKYHPNLYDCYRDEYISLLEFAKKHDISNDKMLKSVNLNLLKRLNSICRMNIRRKNGIKEAYNYFEYMRNDTFLETALKQYHLSDLTLFNKTDKKLINTLKTKRIFKLLLLSYGLDYKFRLFRHIKSFYNQFVIKNRR